MTVLGFCGYDFRNVGDDAFLLVLADQVLRAHQGSELRVTSSYRPEGAPSQGFRAIYEGMTPRRGAHLTRLLRYGRKLDAALLFGGSVLHEECHYARERFKLGGLRTLNPGLLTGAVGVSVGPFRTARQESRLVRYLNEMNYVSVRDRSSFEMLRAGGITCRLECLFDPAALLLEIPGVAERLAPVPSGVSPVVGVAPCHVHRYRGGDPERDDQCIRRLVQTLQAANRIRPITWRLFEFNGHSRQGDGAAIEAIAHGLGDEARVEILRYTPDPVHFLREVGRCHALLAMRLHAAVFGFLRQVPLVVLSYHPKCAGFADAIGSDPALVLDADVFDPAALARLVNEVLDQPPRPLLLVEEALASARLHLDHFFTTADEPV
jgi:polysaccharide pyruvyl transferase WcaK-like protein